ncbi:MAG: outer membrane protein assembly factor BamD [Acidobacteriota bacterium]
MNPQIVSRQSVIDQRWGQLRSALLVLLASCMVLGLGCSNSDDPILQLSAEEALGLGKAYLEDEKFYRARQHFNHAFDVAPNTQIGREALLLAADSYFKDGDSEDLIQAEAKYRDYLNRYPTSNEAAYVQFQIANCLADRIRRADRDQTPTEQALVAYEEVLRLYPTSEFGARARERMGEMRNRLAEHEYVVGEFYSRFRMPGSCINRLVDLLEDFPDYQERAKVYLLLAESYNELRIKTKTVEYIERLQREYPNTEYAKDARDIDVREPLATFEQQAANAAAGVSPDSGAESSEGNAEGSADGEASSESSGDQAASDETAGESQP